MLTEQLFGRAVTRSSLEREVRGTTLGHVKSDAVLPTACHRSKIVSKAVLPPCCHGAMTRRWARQTCYTLWRNTTSRMKNLV